MTWQVQITPQVEQWLQSLGAKDRQHVAQALDRLADVGPTLGTPLVKRIKSSRHHNMKELRYGNYRALFAFDPRQRAVVLAAGDKTGDWRGWYERNIPIADRLYDRHLRSIGGGDHQWKAQRAGVRSAANSR